MRYSSTPSPRSHRKILWAISLSACIPVLLWLICLSRPNSPFDFLGTRQLIASYTDGGFQDYTDYQKYQCENVRLDKNRAFTPITEESADIFILYLADFERWVTACGEDSSLAQNYDFDRALIDTADYFYIDDGTDDPDGSTSEHFFNYDVYFFDHQSSVLYFFHNNI